MNSIVTFEQAKKLKDIGFNAEVHRYFLYERLISSDDFDYNGINKIHCSVPTLSEALDWIREEKGIACGVSPDYNTVKTGEFYAGKGFNGHCVKVVYRYIYEFYDDKHDRHWKKFDTHPLAENALLDAVLTYLENK